MGEELIDTVLPQPTGVAPEAGVPGQREGQVIPFLGGDSGTPASSQTGATISAVESSDSGEQSAEVSSGSAIWRNKDSDQQVTVLGDAGAKDGREYVYVENPNSPAGYSALPRDEITFDEPSPEAVNEKDQELKEQERIARSHQIGATVESETSDGQETHHTLVTPDVVSGEVSKKEVDADFAEKFNQYKASQESQAGEQAGTSDTTGETAKQTSAEGQSIRDRITPIKPGEEGHIPAGNNQQGLQTGEQGAGDQATVGNDENNSELDPNSINDIVNVDAKGRGHISDSENSKGRSRNGQFLSGSEMEQIAANQDLIREGVGNRDGTPEAPNPPDDGNPENNDGNPPNDETNNEGGEGNGEPSENPPDNGEIPGVVQELAPEIVAREQANEALTHAIDQHALAKDRLERMFAGSEARELFQASEVQLAEATNKFIEANAVMVNAQNQNLERLEQANQQQIDEAMNRLSELLAQREDAKAAGNYDGSLDEEISKERDIIVDGTIYEGLFQEVRDKRQAELDAYNLEVVTDIHNRVDKAMLDERTRRHPRLAKVGEWLKQHPKTRIAVGLGLTAMGVIGAATFNAPLVAVATAGGAALRGYGSYNFARGIGDRIANRRMDKADLQTVEDYLSVSRAESDTRRRSKRVGVGVAAALIAAPLVGKMLDVFQHPATAGPRPPAPPLATTTTPPVPVTVTPIDGNMVPWTFAEQVLHTNISDPSVLGQLVHNTQGITFDGNGLGGGLGAIRSVVINGQTFTDLGHINGAIQSILGNAA